MHDDALRILQQRNLATPEPTTDPPGVSRRHA
jgi:hypothetical protein